MRAKRSYDLDLVQSYPGGASRGSRAVVHVPLGPVLTASELQ